MHLSLADHWHSLEEAGKILLLKRALLTDTPLDTTLLDDDASEMDRLALPLGFVPVYVAGVDAAGLSYHAPGVVSPAIADRYRARKVSPAKPRADIDVLFDQCALILEKLGKDVACGRVCGYLGVPSRVYEDDRMTVHQVIAPHAEAGLFELVMYYDRTNHPHKNNPVIMRDKDGTVFRCHGEWTLLRGHVADVASTLTTLEAPEVHAAPEQPLALEAAIEQLQAIATAPHAHPRTLSVRINNPGGMSGHQTVGLISLHAGFDWESGQVVLEPSAPLTRLSKDQVAAIQESVRKGTSWHAYEQQKKLRDRIKELEAEVAALKGLAQPSENLEV